MFGSFFLRFELSSIKFTQKNMHQIWNYLICNIISIYHHWFFELAMECKYDKFSGLKSDLFLVSADLHNNSPFRQTDRARLSHEKSWLKRRICEKNLPCLEVLRQQPQRCNPWQNYFPLLGWVYLMSLMIDWFLLIRIYVELSSQKPI